MAELVKGQVHRKGQVLERGKSQVLDRPRLTRKFTDPRTSGTRQHQIGCGSRVTGHSLVLLLNPQDGT